MRNEIDLTRDENTRIAVECSSVKDFCLEERIDEMNETLPGSRTDWKLQRQIYEGLQSFHGFIGMSIFNSCCSADNNDLTECCTAFPTEKVLHEDKDLGTYAAVIAVSRYFVGLEDKVRNIVLNMKLLQSEGKINIGMDDDDEGNTIDCTSRLAKAVATPEQIFDIDLKKLQRADACNFTGNPVAQIELKRDKYILPYRVMHSECMEHPTGESCARSIALLVARQELRRNFNVPGCGNGTSSWECK